MKVRDAIVELRSTQLFKLMAKLDRSYADRAEKFLRAVTPILASTVDHFPYYTRHDAHHGYRVIRRIEQVVKPACFEPARPEGFQAPEIFLLILSAYAHDLGMTVFPDEAQTLLAALGLTEEAGWRTHEALQAHLRREHSRRGGDYIIARAEDLAVPQNLVAPLDRMMRAHNLSVDALETEIPHVYAADERPIDVRQLALILCVADALEFSDTRVLDGVLETIAKDASEAARVSYRENMKHLGIGDSLAIDDNGRVQVSGTFGDETVLALAHTTLDQMESWIAGYCDIDRRLATPRLRVLAEPFLRNLEFPQGVFERLGIRLNRRKVIDLIASNAVWRDNGGLAIRELIQNAVEACRYREHHSSRADAYAPQVTVTFDRANHEISVEDNGCGMTERVVLNNLLTVGASRASEPAYAAADYAPIARFGIGFWSVFTIAQTAHVETASFEPCRGDAAGSRSARGVAFEISLDELKDYTVFRPVTRPCGSGIRLRLKSGVHIDDLHTAAKGLVLCSAIPVALELDGERIELPAAVPNVPDEAILGHRSRVISDHGIRIFQWRGEQGDTELSLAIAYRIDDGKPTFLVSQNRSISTVLPSLIFPRSAICGFSAPIRPKNLCLDLHRVGTFYANRRTPAGIEFSLDRSQLIENAASRAFANEVTDLVHTGYRAFLDETGGRDLETVAALRTQSAMHGGNVYDSFTEDELLRAARDFPDLAPIKLYAASQDAPPIFVAADQLGEQRGRVWSLTDERARGALSRYAEGAESAAVVRALMRNIPEDQRPDYVMETDRIASWLFDADPKATVSTILFGSAPIQVLEIGLERVDVLRPPAVLAKVRGRWTGTLYLRGFETPDSKPYLFLGRHRVLIRPDGALANRVRELVEGGRLSRLSELIYDLKEDEAGFASPSVQDLAQTVGS